MINKYNYNKFLILSSIFIILITLLLFFNNFINISGYWFDEWCTLLNADPNSDLTVFFDRLLGNHEKPYENVPAIYYLVLRFFFSLFGYTSENGRIFSIIFLVLSFISVYLLSRKVLDKSQSLFVSSVFLSTPLIFWMGNETRVDMFLVFFSTTNSLFFINLVDENNKKNAALLFFSNILTLSIYPLTISLIASQIIFFIIKKNFNLSFLIILSVIAYFALNYEYILDKSTNLSDHFATLNFSFFIGLYFNVFFGSVLFGAIYILSCFYFLIKNYKKICENNFLKFIVLVIVITYLMVVLSSLYVTPIAAPRYIIFIIPLIVIFISANIFLFENKRIFIYLFVTVAVLNLSLNYDNQHIKKPKLKETLKIVKDLGRNEIFLLPQDKLFTNYVSTIKHINEFKVLNKEEIFNQKIESFVIICLNNPGFAFKVKPKKIQKRCLENYLGYNEIRSINFDDFLIRIMKKIK